jgi:hypothetical protein
MPVFRVQVNYVRSLNEKWSNVWHVSAADIPTAVAGCNSALVPSLLPILHSACQIQSFLVSDEVGDLFVTQPVNAAGTSPDSGDMLPLFNSMKVLFIDASFGRPDYKYFKGYLTESLHTNSFINDTTIAAVQIAMGDMIDDMESALTPLVSSDNDSYNSASVQAAVQMRQMHRKRKKSAPATP